MDSVFLSEVEAYLGREVRPYANDIDQNPEQLRVAMDGLFEKGWMALRRPARFGGPELSEFDFRMFQEEIARASGTLAFLQTQHQSAVSLIAKGSNDELKERLLPGMSHGGHRVGIGFSQLRRPGEPLTQATKAEGGYRIDGHVPWVTGWTFYESFLIGAQLPDGRAVFGVVPFDDEEGLKLSAPMELAAMEAAQTVTVDLDDWFLSEADVVDIKPPNWIFRNDQINITLQGFFALGCARAGLDVVWSNFERRGHGFLKSSYGQLMTEVDQCRQAMVDAQARSGEETTQDKLMIRGWAIELAMRCAHAAVASSGGAANSLAHPAQRILREALVFTVSAQTVDIMESTMKRIVGPLEPQPTFTV